jgi:oligo-1,6-glucosidase
VSRYGDAVGYPVESAKMLATVLHLLKGTPFVYQGEEIGMTNMPFTTIEQYRDIETLNMYRLHLEAGLSPEEFIAGANQNGRDNARTPMQWSSAAYGGFSTALPWIEVNPNYATINAEVEMTDERSVWNHYRRLIALRKAHPVIVYGEYRSWLDDHPEIFAYTRTRDEDRLVVIANFTAKDVTAELPDELQIAGECLISNYDPVNETGQTISLKPYESYAILVSRA